MAWPEWPWPPQTLRQIYATGSCNHHISLHNVCWLFHWVLSKYIVQRDLGLQVSGPCYVTVTLLTFDGQSPVERLSIHSSPLVSRHFKFPISVFDSMCLLTYCQHYLGFLSHSFEIRRCSCLVSLTVSLITLLHYVFISRRYRPTPKWMFVTVSCWSSELNGWKLFFFTFLGRLLFFSLYISVHDCLEVFLGFIKARPPSLYDFECTTTKSSSSRVSQWCNFEFYSPCRKHYMVSRHGDVSWKVVFVANLILFPAANDPIDLLDRIAGSAGRWGG